MREGEISIDPYEALLVCEVWEAVDALSEDERDALLRWLRSTHKAPSRKVQAIIGKLRAKLGITEGDITEASE